MKRLALLFILILGIQVDSIAQNVPLNKQQTLDYIEKLFKESFRYEDVKIVNVKLDGKTLNVLTTTGNSVRRDLSKAEPLMISKIAEGYTIHFSSSKYGGILWAIQTEEDEKRLKKALEHLIEILKTEKNTDPFGE